ncbi:peptidoglycan-binding domain-containing protein [Billgrantia antri]|uniref:peptidoglycan-binding domain-containing protein n=1 Tax=Billgrantia antri TaxID=2846777 RepID=UPI003B228FB3
MFKKLILTTAVSTALATGSAGVVFAQQNQSQSSNQQITQEQAQGQGTQVYLSTASVRQIQQALNQQGFDVGQVDGQWTDTTAQAAGNYQQSNGLEPTGTPTIQLINALGLSNVLSGGQGGGGQGGGGQGGGGQGGDMQWSQEESQGSGTPIYVSTAGVRQIQQALNQQGYEIGQVDGLWGNSTSQAARNFQQAQGLEPNGQLNVQLISAIGLNQQLLSGGQGGGGQSQGGGGQGQGGQGGQGSNMQWSQEQAQSSGTPLWVSPAVVRQIEQTLNQNGFDVENVDGQWEDSTTQAVGNYQQSNGLEPTGTLTTELLNSLGMNNWMSGQFGGGQGGGSQSGGSQSGGSQGGGSQGGGSQGGGSQGGGSQGGGSQGGGSQGGQS